MAEVQNPGRISFGSPEPLVLHKLVSNALVQKCIDDNLLEKQPWEWHIGLRQTVEVAVSRASFYEEDVSKDSHVMLRVTFTSLGVALFASTFTDETNNFRQSCPRKSFPMIKIGGFGTSSKICRCQCRHLMDSL